MGIAGTREGFQIVAEAHGKPTGGRIPLLAGLDDEIFIGDVVGTAGSLGLVRVHREGAARAGVRVEQLIFIGGWRTVLAGERIVEIGLRHAGDDCLRVRYQQRVVVAVAVGQAAGPQVERIERIAARVVLDVPVIGVFTVQVEVPALLLVIAIAGGQRRTIMRAIALLGRTAFGRPFDALEMLLADQVDHAADRVRAVGRRRAVLQHLDTVDDAERDRVEIDIGVVAVVVEREVRRTQPVDQHHGRRDTKAAQRHRGAARREAVAEAGGNRPGAVGRHRADRGLRGRDVRAFQRLRGQHGHRRDRGRVGVAEQRAGDDDLVALAGIGLRGGLARLLILDGRRCRRLRRCGLIRPGSLCHRRRRRVLRMGLDRHRGQQRRGRNAIAQGRTCRFHQSHQAHPLSCSSGVR